MRDAPSGPHSGLLTSHATSTSHASSLGCRAPESGLAPRLPDPGALIEARIVEAEPAAEPEPTPEAVVEEEEEEDDSGSNIFMLKRPMKKKGAPAGGEPVAAEPAPEPAAEPAAETPAADAGEEEEKKSGGGNIFMLGKKK